MTGAVKSDAMALMESGWRDLDARFAALDEHVDEITTSYAQLPVGIEELRLRDDAFALAPDIHHDRIVRELDDQARNNLSFGTGLGAVRFVYRRLEHGGKAVVS